MSVNWGSMKTYKSYNEELDMEDRISERYERLNRNTPNLDDANCNKQFLRSAIIVILDTIGLLAFMFVILYLIK